MNEASPQSADPHALPPVLRNRNSPRFSSPSHTIISSWEHRDSLVVSGALACSYSLVSFGRNVSNAGFAAFAHHDERARR